MFSCGIWKSALVRQVSTPAYTIPALHDFQDPTSRYNQLKYDWLCKALHTPGPTASLFVTCIRGHRILQVLCKQLQLQRLQHRHM